MEIHHIHQSPFIIARIKHCTVKDWSMAIIRVPGFIIIFPISYSCMLPPVSKVAKDKVGVASSMGKYYCLTGVLGCLEIFPFNPLAICYK